jgi:hypothetical protein
MKINSMIICFVIDLQWHIPIIVTAELENGMSLSQIHGSIRNPFSKLAFLQTHLNIMLPPSTQPSK